MVYVDCSRILSGTISEKAEQCYGRCTSISEEFNYFSVHDETACFCRRSNPVGPFDSDTAAEDCTSPSGNNIIYAIRNTGTQFFKRLLI